MGALSPPHPTDQVLRAHGLGTLDPGASSSVDSHLSGCPDCRRRASSFSGEGSLDRPGGAASGAGAADGALPPELAELPGYAVVRELGRGGMGVVYLAENTLMGRMEVLKVVRGHLVERPGVLDRFLREIRSAARLQHPNIVAAHAAMRVGAGVVLAMEYVAGEDLAELVKSRGPLPVANACFFTSQAALGLQHAHERGMVHRDIKPANLMLAREGRRATVKVLDFGLAKATSEGQLDSGLTREGQMLGTPDFIAPEQIVDAQRADIRADIYSLGCTLYYLLSGGAPFRATSLYELLQAHHSTDAPSLTLARPDVPAELAALVARMMAKDPARRFQTPGEVAQALATFYKPAAGSPPSSSAEAPRAVPPAAPAAKATPKPKPGAGGVAWSTLIELGQGGASPSESPEDEPEAEEWDAEPSRSRWPIFAGISALGLTALAIVVAIAMGRGKPTPPPPGESAPPGVVAGGKPIPDDSREPSRAGGTGGTTTAAAVSTPPPGTSGGSNVVVERGASAPAATPAATSASVLHPDFDGGDLAGWSAWGTGGPLNREETRQVWSVREGNLIGSGRRSRLLSPRGDYGDVRVRARIKIHGEGSFGLVLRAAKGGDFSSGHAIPIDGTEVGSRADSLGGASARVDRGDPSQAAADRWSVLEAEAVGDRVRATIDGKPCLDEIQDPSSDPRGHVAIQIQDSSGQLEIRGLEVIDLGSSGRSIPGPSPAIAGRPGGENPAKLAPPADSDSAAWSEREGHRVPIRPGVLKVATSPPDAFWPNLTPGDAEGWRVADPSLVRMEPKGLVVEAGSGGNFLLTRRSDYRKSAMSIQLAASAGAEAYLVLRAERGPDGWRGVTSRIVDEGGKVRAGWQAVDFALPERGGNPGGVDSRADVRPNATFAIRFSIDAKAKASTLAQLKTVTLVHDGPRPVDGTAGAVGLFVRRGSVTVRSLRVEE